MICSLIKILKVLIVQIYIYNIKFITLMIVIIIKLPKKLNEKYFNNYFSYISTKKKI